MYTIYMLDGPLQIPVTLFLCTIAHVRCMYHLHTLVLKMHLNCSLTNANTFGFFFTYGTIDEDGYDNFPLTIVSTLFNANLK